MQNEQNCHEKKNLTIKKLSIDEIFLQIRYF